MGIANIIIVDEIIELDQNRLANLGYTLLKYMIKASLVHIIIGGLYFFPSFLLYMTHHIYTHSNKQNKFLSNSPISELI